MEHIGTNLRQVRERIGDAALRVGRDPAEVVLVAVTKTQPAKTIRAAYDLGLRDFGENRLGEAESKFDRLPDDIRWHMVGHVQSRKASRAVQPYVLVHSVDTAKVARRLDRFASMVERELPILLECNVSGEASKYGLSPEELPEVVAEVADLASLRLRGLMTMAPIVEEPELARPVFRALRELRDELAARYPAMDWSQLSMGMTDDFEVAIEEGATIVRIGRAIFGERH